MVHMKYQVLLVLKMRKDALNLLSAFVVIEQKQILVIGNAYVIVLCNIPPKAMLIRKWDHSLIYYPTNWSRQGFCSGLWFTRKVVYPLYTTAAPDKCSYTILKA